MRSRSVFAEIREIELGQVQRQVLFADAVECSHHTAFQEAEESLNRVGVNVAAHVFLCAVVDGCVLVVRVEILVGREIIGHYSGAAYYVLPNGSLEIVAGNAGHHLRADVSAAIDQGNNWSLACASPAGCCDG